VRLTIVGSSPAWPNPGSAHAGYLVESGGRRLLVDCGPGVLARLREHEHWPSVEAIAITHAHLDHVGDLVPWLWGLRMGPGNDGPAPELWLPPGARTILEQLASGESLDEAFVVREYGEEQPFEAAGLSVVPVRMSHFDTVAFGLRVSDGTATIAFSGDTGPTDALVELARDADLLVCEATIADPPPDVAGRGHLSAGEASDAATRAGARRLLVTHRPVELPAPDGIAVAVDGLVVDL
jgi:ribonuclease BN (tRNA processing enzyme)